MIRFLRWGLAGVVWWTVSVGQARVITQVLWISAAGEGVVMGGDTAPGWLGVSRAVSAAGPGSNWLDVGGSRDWETLHGIPDLRLPDAVVPSEALLRVRGTGVWTQPIPWAVLNLGVLPQFPEVEVPVPAYRDVQHPDGFRVRMLGVLSDQAPLRIPPSRLRPYRVLDSMISVREWLVAHPRPADVFPVLVLPEGGEGASWSDALPDFPVLVEAPGGRAQVIELDDGARLRVRPAPNGRALIRVVIRWDTVQRSFLDPEATVEWVRSPNLEALALPDALVPRLRPQSIDSWEPEAKGISAGSGSHVVSFPMPAKVPDTLRLPDARAITAFSEEDDIWTRWHLTAEEWAELLTLPLPVQPMSLEGTGEGVLIPGRIAAGDGGGEWMPLRRFLDSLDFEPDILPFTLRGIPIPSYSEPDS